MATTVVPFKPAADPVTTTVAAVITTTALVCQVTSHNLPDLRARKGQSIGIPSIGFSSNAGGGASFVRITILAIPTKGTLKIGESTLAANANITPPSNGKMIYTAPENFAGTDTFTYKVVTSCGESATMTATITMAPDLVQPCNCETTTV